MSFDPLDTAKYRWQRFFKTTGCFEPTMYKVAGGDIGQVRQGVDHYATSFASNAQRTLNYNPPVNNSDDINRMALLASRNNRYHGINLTNIHNHSKPNTVEVRYFNSSLNPAVIQTNIKIANGIMFASEKARIGSTSDSESMKRRGHMLIQQRIGNNNPNNHSNVRDFVDIAFSRKKDKDAVLKLYAKNSWYNPDRN
jgi:hypothetical protein